MADPAGLGLRFPRKTPKENAAEKRTKYLQKKCIESVDGRARRVVDLVPNTCYLTSDTRPRPVLGRGELMAGAYGSRSETS